MTLRVSFVAGGDASAPPADCPAGALTGMGIVTCTVGAGLLCLYVAGAIRLRTTDVTFRRRPLAAGVCGIVCGPADGG
jgi:hypothetical protein